MFGAIAGDVIGSIFEWNNYKGTDFDLFHPTTDYTDDTVLSIATAEVLLDQSDYTEAYQNYGQNYSDRGYGGNFANWIYSEDAQAYNSWGNGSAMCIRRGCLGDRI